VALYTAAIDLAKEGAPIRTAPAGFLPVVNEGGGGGAIISSNNNIRLTFGLNPRIYFFLGGKNQIYWFKSTVRLPIYNVTIVIKTFFILFCSVPQDKVTRGKIHVV